MKRILTILGILVFLSIVVICVTLALKTITEENDKVQVIATLFPQYDFIKEIGGDKVDVTLLLPSGIESHTFEPSPQDIISVNRADLFVYTGEYMEPWAQTIISSVDSDTKVLDVSTNISLISLEEFEAKYTHSHDEDEHEKEDEYEHEYDPHIWLNPVYAIQMVTNIKDMLCEIDPENADYYNQNAMTYIYQLNSLDVEIKDVVNSGERNLIAFGGAFAYTYFIEKYDLEFISAYDSCGEESEPSVAKVREIIDDIKLHDIPVVFYKELSSGNIAKTIAEETGATPLIFHSVHNVSKDAIRNGASYLSLMRENLENLKKALN